MTPKTSLEVGGIGHSVMMWTRWSMNLLALAVELSGRGEPFAPATVVRCERPTSAKPGAKALILQDGTVKGWVGGACAEPVVAQEARRAMADGQPRLVALVGEESMRCRAAQRDSSRIR